MNNIICDYMNNMNENQPNPKCPICRCYFVPTLKSSGLPYKSCEKCRNKNRDYKIKIKCEHNRRKENCRDCGGSQICEHNKQKSSCKDCGGASLCKHNKRKSRCKDCGGASLCEHNRRKEKCKDCNIQKSKAVTSDSESEQIMAGCVLPSPRRDPNGQNRIVTRKHD